MKENDSSAANKPVKTYISENNQNTITSTLTVEVNQSNYEATSQEDANSIEDKSSSEGVGKVVQPSQNEEPEVLNAPVLHTPSDHTDSSEMSTPVYPPTSAATDAEMVAGLPIGSLSGQEENPKS